MYKMMIVDDESWIRERIIHSIDWGKLEVGVVGEADDGEEALEMFKELLPEIVITDIRMPGIDGLEFTQKLKEIHSTAKVIIISGFSDFEYAKKAIKYEAFDYILKPVENSDLISVVQRCIEQINIEKSKQELFKQAEVQIKASMPLLKERFVSDLINDYISRDKDVLRELNYYGVKNDNLNHICYIVQIDDYETVIEDNKKDNNFIQFVICNIAKDFNNKISENELLFSYLGEVAFIVSSDGSVDTFTRQVISVSNGIRKMVKKILGCSVTIGIGEACNNINDISLSYLQAKKAVLNKAYFGKDRIYDIRSMDMYHKSDFYGFYETEALINNIMMGSKENALSSLNTIIRDIDSKNKEMRPVELKFIYIDIVNSIFKTSFEGKSSSEEFSDFSFNFFEQLYKLQTIEEIERWLSDIIEKIIDYLEKSRNGKKRKIVDKAIGYIENNYNQPITLNDIADKMFLNASYFCKVFKDTTGESFTKYLMKLRAQKAIQLMNDPTLKIYEIAQKVGYDDVQYFIKVFKSIKGVSPTQYREKVK